ncbi:hypothetical protein DSECCO2_599080 [anaerobic digester metagenome]
MPVQQFEADEFGTRNVVHPPDGADDPSGFVPNVLALFGDVTEFPVIAAKDPMLDLVAVPPVGDRGKIHCIEHSSIIRMDHREEHLVGRRMLSGFKAEDAVGLVRPDQPPGQVIELPAAEVRKALCFVQHLFAPAQRRLRPPPPGQLPDCIGKLGKLRPRIAAFLEVEVGTAVQRLDCHLLASPAGEDDEGYPGPCLPDML